MVGLAQTKGVDPKREVAARRRHARNLADAIVDVGPRHARQLSASARTGAFIAEAQMIEDTTMLRIKERQRRACGRQRTQEIERVSTLHDVEGRVDARRRDARSDVHARSSRPA